MKVALLGAPASGKTELSLALKSFFQSYHIPLEVLDSPDIQTLAQEDAALLCGLDLSPSNETQSVADHAIRASLHMQGIGFQVVYGQDAQRLQNALFCLANQLPQWAHALRRSDIPVRWTGPCETCGDGLCEHQLFTQLVSNKK